MAARLVRLDLVVDTSFYTALQLQPRVLLAQSWNAFAAWCRSHLAPYSELLRVHRLGHIVLSAQIRYREQLRYFDSDTLTVESGVTLRREGSRVVQTSTFSAAGRCAASVRMVLCPVAIQEDRSLSAAPTTMPADLVRRFLPDEIDDSPLARTMPALLDRVRSDCRELATGEHEFRFAHHLCEMADQWASTEVPSFTDTSRMAVALDHCAGVAELKRCLAEPMTALDMELYRPYFVFDRAVVSTSARGGGSTLAFVHELHSTSEGGPHGVVVEQYG